MNSTLCLMLFAATITGCVDREPVAMGDVGTASPTTAPAGTVVKKTAAEWKKLLSADTYHIMFEAGTERPFTNAFHKKHDKGTYVSAATGVPLFSSADKYDSGTGWPSFTRAINEGAVILRPDQDGSGRVEVLDASSGGHLGHLFDDGPAPTGNRFCMNSGAMKFIPATK